MNKANIGKQERGRIERCLLKRPITLNSNVITIAVIEIDHINFGLDTKAKKLNKIRRTNFSLADVEKFLDLLDGEYIFPRNHRGRTSRFEIRINCPVKGRFYGKEFIMIFDTDYDKQNEIHTITIFPGW